MSTVEKTINNADPLITEGGNSFYIHDVPGAGVTVEIRRNSQTIHKAENVQEGWEYWGVPLPGEDRVFDSVKISCATSNAIKVEVSQARTRLNRAAGSVDVTNAPLITANTLVTPWGARVNSALITIVTPAANINGVRIDAINLMDVGDASRTRFMSKTSAPSSMVDAAAKTLYFNQYDTASANMHTNPLINTIIIPAGEGVYAQATATSGCFFSMSYKVL